MKLFQVGRIAQRESIGLTSRRSQVQILFRLPEIADSCRLMADSKTEGFKRGRSSVWLERRPVTSEVASSSLVVPASKQSHFSDLDIAVGSSSRFTRCSPLRAVVATALFFSARTWKYLRKDLLVVCPVPSAMTSSGL